MKLTRKIFGGIVKWDLDGKYEITANYHWYSLDDKGTQSSQPGYVFTIKDLETSQEHSLKTNGLNSEQRGIHNFPIK